MTRGLWQSAGLDPITGKRPSQIGTLAEGECHVRIPVHTHTQCRRHARRLPGDAAGGGKTRATRPGAGGGLRAPRSERTFVATIRPRVESDLGFRVAGKVAKRLVSVGDAVKVGQALAALDATDLRLQREQAEAEVRAASAALQQAEAELRRILTLRGQGWSTTATLDRQQAVTEEVRGRVARAERALLLAENALSYATLTADIDGVITATQIEPGHVVDTDKVAIRIARLAEKEAVIAVPEAQVTAIRTGVASLSLWSNPDKRYQATLREFSPSADPATRTYLARFSIPDRGRAGAARHDGDGHDR